MDIGSWQCMLEAPRGLSFVAQAVLVTIKRFYLS
jgi:hypothetical protein